MIQRSDLKFILIGYLVTTALITWWTHHTPAYRIMTVTFQSPLSISYLWNSVCKFSFFLMPLSSSGKLMGRYSICMFLTKVFRHIHTKSIFLEDFQNQLENSISKIFNWTDMKIVIYGTYIAFDKIYNMNKKNET